MLISTMNHTEVTREYIRDFDILRATTVDRLFGEYDRERRKRKVDPAKDYMKVYPIKTKAKNNWLIFIVKPPAFEKYRDIYDIGHWCISYYHDDKGLKVLRRVDEGSHLEVFTGHFFTRYNERLKLNLSSPLDIVKHFFQNDGIMQHYLRKQDDQWTNMSICKNGMALGVLNSDETWLLHRTFISNEMMKGDQDVYRFFLELHLEKEYIKAMANSKADERTVIEKMNLLLALAS